MRSEKLLRLPKGTGNSVKGNCGRGRSQTLTHRSPTPFLPHTQRMKRLCKGT